MKNYLYSEFCSQIVKKRKRVSFLMEYEWKKKERHWDKNSCCIVMRINFAEVMVKSDKTVSSFVKITLKSSYAIFLNII